MHISPKQTRGQNVLNQLTFLLVCISKIGL